MRGVHRDDLAADIHKHRPARFVRLRPFLERGIIGLPAPRRWRLRIDIDDHARFFGVDHHSAFARLPGLVQGLVNEIAAGIGTA